MSIDNPSSRKRGYWRWPLIIVGLLMAHVTLMTIAVAIISQRPGESAVISNYYEKEISYDSYKAQVAASKKLGWNVNAEQTGEVDAMGLPRVRLSLVDANSRGIDNAELSVHCFQWSHGDQAATLDAKAAGSGQYVFELPRKYPGFWELDVTVKRGDQTFIQTVTLFVNQG